jgi:hypothetical protein
MVHLPVVVSFYGFADGNRILKICACFLLIGMWKNGIDVRTFDFPFFAVASKTTAGITGM